MKGVSSVIAIIILLMITIALSALSYTWFSQAFQAVSKSGEESLKQVTTSGQSMLKIESVSEDKIYIRNVGGVDLTNISLYVQDTPVTYNIDKQTVQPGEVATITIIGNAPAGEIEITTAQGALTIQGNYQGYTESDSPPAYSNIETYSPVIYSPSTYSWMNITWTDDVGLSLVRIESNYSDTPVNYSPTQSGSIYYLRSILPAGTHEWRSFAQDTASQWTTSTTQTFTINSDNPPSYSGIATYSPASYSQSTYSWMNITWTDDVGLSLVRIESNYSGTPVNYSPTQSGSIYYLRSILPAGSHRWRSFAQDTASQWTTSTTQTFTINRAATTTNLYLNGTAADRSYTRYSIANFTVTLTASGRTVYLNSNYTGWSLRSSTTPLYNFTNLTTTGNKWNLTGYFSGDTNFSPSSRTLFFNVTP